MNTKLIEPVCFPIFTVRGHFSSTGYSPHFTDFFRTLRTDSGSNFTRCPPRLPRRALFAAQGRFPGGDSGRRVRVRVVVGRY